MSTTCWKLYHRTLEGVDPVLTMGDLDNEVEEEDGADEGEGEGEDAGAGQQEKS